MNNKLGDEKVWAVEASLSTVSKPIYASNISNYEFCSITSWEICTIYALLHRFKLNTFVIILLEDGLRLASARMGCTFCRLKEQHDSLLLEQPDGQGSFPFQTIAIWNRQPGVPLGTLFDHQHERT